MVDRITRTAGSLSAVLLFMMLPVGASHAEGGVVPFDSDRWVTDKAEVVDYLGRKCLQGTAWLEDVAFENGVIEVDVAVSGARSYPGIIFRMQSQDEYERFYVRPHRAGLYPDALQYTPVFNGVAGWQLYHGPGFTAGCDLPANEWVHLKIEVKGSQARVYVGSNEKPALEIHHLKHGMSTGGVGVMGPRDATAYFSNFSYKMDDGLAFETPPERTVPPFTITDWEISRPFKTTRINTKEYPRFFTVFNAGWRKVDVEPSGLVNVSRYAKSEGQGPDCVLARTIVRSDKKQDVTLDFGYSDEVTVFLNGKKLFTGESAYRSRDRSFLGVVGLYDAVYPTLEKGLNEILLIVTESFGGWGFMARADRELGRPVKRHDRLVKLWETADVFKVPESVLYDPGEEILYVTSYNKLQRGSENAGFVSRLRPDGEVEELEWITGLDGPCGMALDGKKLFVVESSGNLVEIDKKKGAVSRRYPIPEKTFLNDVILDGSGKIYVTDTSNERDGVDIYRLQGGRIQVWKSGDEIHRSNGIFIDRKNLIVGNSGDGFLNTVGIEDGRVGAVTCLGAGVIDGIRLDNDGNYLVSQWEGRIYSITPSGEVTEIIDTMEERLNTADFEFIKKTNTLVVPTFLGNKVVAYRLAAG